MNIFSSYWKELGRKLGSLFLSKKGTVQTNLFYLSGQSDLYTFAASVG